MTPVEMTPVVMTPTVMTSSDDTSSDDTSNEDPEGPLPKLRGSESCMIGMPRKIGRKPPEIMTEAPRVKAL
jgi:hypothetical protein